MARARIRRSNSNPIRSTRLCEQFLIVMISYRNLLIAVKGLQAVGIDGLDVATNAALSERKRHPRLEMLDDSRLHVGMFRQEEVQSISPGIHQCLQPCWTCLVLCFQCRGIDEQFHAKVAPDRAFAFGFRHSAQSVYVIGFYAVEIVFSLRIDRAEYCVSIGLTAHMSDAPIVPSDGNVTRLLLPPCQIWGLANRDSGGKKHDGKDENGQSSHFVVRSSFVRLNRNLSACWSNRPHPPHTLLRRAS